MKTPRDMWLPLIVLLSSLALNSAFGQVTKQAAKKFDEFGYMNHENYSARLDNIALALQNEPVSQGYFIFYNGQKSLPGAALRYMRRLQNYMMNLRGVEPARMILLEGGRREEMAVEFWISSPGSRAPIPTPMVSIQPIKTKSYLYDSYSFDCDPLFRPRVKASDYFDDCGYAGSGYEDQAARLNGFIKAISQTPGATAHLRVDFLARDARRRVQKFIQQERSYLPRQGGLHAASIAVTSRRSTRRSVSLWVVVNSVY
jgi:hypothetical protein